MRYTFLLLLTSATLFGQKNITTASDATAPLHALQPDYPTPYGAPTSENIQKTIDRVFAYLETATPTHFVDKTTGVEVKTYNANAIFSKGDFRPISYEWGVTYSGMLRVGELTGDQKFTNYSISRINFISQSVPF
ncbi:MAG: glycoside hydrolase family 88 protein, partial [Aquirufa sp.]